MLKSFWVKYHENLVHVSLLLFFDGQIRQNPPVLLANPPTKFYLTLENWPKPKKKVISQSPFCRSEVLGLGGMFP